MIGFLRSRWIVLTVVFPLTAWLLSMIATRVEERTGPSSLTRALQWPRQERLRRKGATG